MSGSEGTVSKRLLEMFTAVSVTDLKLYFFLGETVKREKGGRRGEITDTADTSKHSRGDAAKASGARR